jgi:hypothetical protein
MRSEFWVSDGKLEVSVKPAFMPAGSEIASNSMKLVILAKRAVPIGMHLTCLV